MLSSLVLSEPYFEQSDTKWDLKENIVDTFSWGGGGGATGAPSKSATCACDVRSFAPPLFANPGSASGYNTWQVKKPLSSFVQKQRLPLRKDPSRLAGWSSSKSG